MSDELISVSEIARIHARHRAVIHKIVSRLGIETHSIKSEQARGQKAAYISRNDYELLKEVLQTECGSSLSNTDITNSHGYFYIVQLEPSLEAILYLTYPLTKVRL